MKIFLIFPCCDVLSPHQIHLSFSLLHQFFFASALPGWVFSQTFITSILQANVSPLLQCHSWPCWLAFLYCCLCHLNQNCWWATYKTGSNLVYKVLHTVRFDFWKRDWFLNSICVFQAFMKTELLIFSFKFLAHQVIETLMTSTTNEEVVVQWITSQPETTKYVVEWYEELEMDPFGRSWQYVSNSTEWKNNKSMFISYSSNNVQAYL